jgi:hypothetical protein
MPLLAEHVPENDWARFPFEIRNFEFLCTFNDFRIIPADLTHSREIAFYICHENWHSPRAKIFRERLQRYCFACARRPSDQAVAIRHLGQEIDGLGGLSDKNGVIHGLILGKSAALSSIGRALRVRPRLWLAATPGAQDNVDRKVVTQVSKHQ